MNSQQRRPVVGNLVAVILGVVLGVAPFHSTRGQAPFFDDFNDGNDNGWERYDVLRPVAPPFGGTYSFPGGNSYRLTTPGNYTVPELGRGRVGSLVTGPNYSDFRVVVDIVDWNDDREYVFGAFARVLQPGLGTTDGYLITLNGWDDDFQLLRIENEAPNDNEVADINVTLPTNADFRLVFTGVGNQLNGIVYNMTDLNTPLAGFVVDAANYGPPPTPAPYTTGRVGLVVAQSGATDDGAGPPYGTTFDNFQVTVPVAGEWNAVGGGKYFGQGFSSFNWAGNVPPEGVGAHARFLRGAEIDAEVDIDLAGVTMGKITFDNAHKYKLVGQPFTLSNTDGIELTVVSGSHEIANNVLLGNSVRFSGTGTLTISAPLDWQGKSVAVASGNLRLAKINQGNLNVTGGAATLIPASGTSVVNSLSIAGGAAPTGKLDVTNNPVVLDYTGASPVSSVREQLIAGRGGSGLGKPWNGNGITSSQVQADVAAIPHSMSVGYAENSALFLGALMEFRGQPVDTTAVLIAYTRTGDANLDGVVDNDDVTIVGANYAPGFAKPHWALGDFDFSGFVDNDDVTLLGAFYNPDAPPIGGPAAPALAAVPEPASVLLLIAAAVILVARRGFTRRKVGRVE